MYYDFYKNGQYRATLDFDTEAGARVYAEALGFDEYKKSEKRN